MERGKGSGGREGGKEGETMRQSLFQPTGMNTSVRICIVLVFTQVQQANYTAGTSAQNYLTIFTLWKAREREKEWIMKIEHLAPKLLLFRDYSYLSNPYTDMHKTITVSQHIELIFSWLIKKSPTFKKYIFNLHYLYIFSVQKNKPWGIKYSRWSWDKIAS